jgi:FMN reductase
MKTAFNVLGVAGSTRRGSYSAQALKIGLEHAKKQGAEVRLLDINRLPLYDPNAPASREVEQAAEAVS